MVLDPLLKDTIREREEWAKSYINWDFKVVMAVIFFK